MDWSKVTETATSSLNMVAGAGIFLASLVPGILLNFVIFFGGGYLRYGRDFEYEDGVVASAVSSVFSLLFIYVPAMSWYALRGALFWESCLKANVQYVIIYLTLLGFVLLCYTITKLIQAADRKRQGIRLARGPIPPTPYSGSPRNSITDDKLEAGLNSPDTPPQSPGQKLRARGERLSVTTEASKVQGLIETFQGKH